METNKQYIIRTLLKGKTLWRITPSGHIIKYGYDARRDEVCRSTETSIKYISVETATRQLTKNFKQIN